jgi:osomolarity two-component system, phosphorelay intermediate protein YPD1
MSVDFGDSVDMETFSQILEMDDVDEGQYDFSKPLVFGFFDQAEQTFKEMEEML